MSFLSRLFGGNDEPEPRPKPRAILRSWKGEEARSADRGLEQSNFLNTGKSEPAATIKARQQSWIGPPDMAQIARNNRIREGDRLKALYGPDASMAANAPGQPLGPPVTVENTPGIVPDLNRTNARILREQGWGLPAPSGTMQPQAAALATTGGPAALQQYTYSLDPGELELLQDEYAGAKGFMQPEPGGTAAKPAFVRTGEVQSQELTWEAYNALSDDQRKAVDYNTLLLKARESDLASKSSVPKDETDEVKAYNATVEKLFGKEGGSNIYAPETVRLLDKMGYTAKGQDLDEYLSLDRLISADELAGYKAPGDVKVAEWELNPSAVYSPTIENKFADVRSVGNQLAVDSMAIEKAGQFVTEALKDPTVWSRDSAVFKALTGELPTGMDVPFGYGTDDSRKDAEGNLPPGVPAGIDNWIRDTYGVLINPEQDMSHVWAMIEETGADQQQIQQLFNYFDQQTKKDILIGAVDPAVLSPQEVRKKAGLED